MSPNTTHAPRARAIWPSSSHEGHSPGECRSPSTLGRQPRASWAARSAATATNSNAPMVCGGRITVHLAQHQRRLRRKDRPPRRRAMRCAACASPRGRVDGPVRSTLPSAHRMRSPSLDRAVAAPPGSSARRSRAKNAQTWTLTSKALVRARARTAAELKKADS